ncbi:hypothetical protein HPB49_010926 [Dermacentor silvarum]|uniref:Uncharacterized protein n=1 Tax=Dermacentor silvarum TaxID=543639 RepID=A0ACB8DZD7_DERSI|nr:hypothetical protein HPB49_010926 [Dermacentor silvarum]
MSYIHGRYHRFIIPFIDLLLPLLILGARKTTDPCVQINFENMDRSYSAECFISEAQTNGVGDTEDPGVTSIASGGDSEADEGLSRRVDSLSVVCVVPEECEKLTSGTWKEGPGARRLVHRRRAHRPELDHGPDRHRSWFLPFTSKPFATVRMTASRHCYGMSRRWGRCPDGGRKGQGVVSPVHSGYREVGGFGTLQRWPTLCRRLMELYVDANLRAFDLSIEHRKEINDTITLQATQALEVHNVGGVKCAITS